MPGGRRQIVEPTNVVDAMRQLEPYNGLLSGDKPRWGLQAKSHSGNAVEMGAKSVLKDGFANFYSASEPVTRIGDTVRKHVTKEQVPEYGQETHWRPCFRLVKRDIEPPRRFGKKAIEPLAAKSEEDLPRGKKHGSAPIDQLPSEMDLFKSKKRVQDEMAPGKAMAERVTDLTATDPNGEVREGVRKVDDLVDRRNGVPQTRNGDKLFSAVEYSAEYAQAMGPAMPKLNYAKVVIPQAPVDVWAAKERHRQHVADIDSVRRLPPIHDN